MLNNSSPCSLSRRDTERQLNPPRHCDWIHRPHTAAPRAALAVDCTGTSDCDERCSCYGVRGIDGLEVRCSLMISTLFYTSSLCRVNSLSFIVSFFPRSRLGVQAFDLPGASRAINAYPQCCFSCFLGTRARPALLDLTSPRPDPAPENFDVRTVLTRPS